MTGQGDRRRRPTADERWQAEREKRQAERERRRAEMEAWSDAMFRAVPRIEDPQTAAVIRGLVIDRLPPWTVARQQRITLQKLWRLRKAGFAEMHRLVEQERAERSKAAAPSTNGDNGK